MSSTNFHAHRSQVDEAIHTLDQICSARKPFGVQSIDSIQAKHLDPLCNDGLQRVISTPALESLRSRGKCLKKSNLTTSGKRTNQTRARPPTSDQHEISQKKIHPTSQVEFLSRLKTYRMSSYPSGIPRSISPPTMSALGWCNVQKNRLKCETCAATWVLATPSNGDWKTNSGCQLAQLGQKMSIDQHRRWCPWRTRRCSSSVYRCSPWGNGLKTIQLLVYGAKELLNHISSDLCLEHPLAQEDVKLLITAASMMPGPDSPVCDLRNKIGHSDALILTLFGWTVNPSLKILAKSQHPTPSLSNDGQNLYSHLQPLCGDTQPPITLSCAFCHRDAMFPSPSKPFNTLTEHREFCPYLDSQSGFFDSSSSLPSSSNLKAVWELHLFMIRNFVERQLNKPSTLKHLVDQFCLTSPRSAGEEGDGLACSQLNVVGMVKAALGSSSHAFFQ